MGTSVNQSSPNEPKWRLARATLGRRDVAPTDQVAELWRSAATDREGALLRELSDPLLGRAMFLCATQPNAKDALTAFDAAVVESRTSNFAVELGRRALGRAALAGGGAANFAAELFAETTNYYVSRDLPGFVGSPNHVKTAIESLALRQDLRGVARSAAASVTPPTEARWPEYVATVMARLTE